MGSVKKYANPINIVKKVGDTIGNVASGLSDGVESAGDSIQDFTGITAAKEAAAAQTKALEEAEADAALEEEQAAAESNTAKSQYATQKKKSLNLLGLDTDQTLGV